MKQIAFFILIVFGTILTTGLIAYADEPQMPEPMQIGNPSWDKVNRESSIPIQDPKENYKKGEVEEWALSKGDDVIYFLQRIVQPFATIIFVISAFIMMVGSVSDRGWVTKGLWGMCISCCCYAAVLYAPDIIRWFPSWLIS